MDDVHSLRLWLIKRGYGIRATLAIIHEVLSGEQNVLKIAAASVAALSVDNLPLPLTNPIQQARSIPLAIGVLVEDLNTFRRNSICNQ